MCPEDQKVFRTVTQSATACVSTCDLTPGCKSLIYLDDNKTCFGVKSYDPFSTSSPLPGAVFYKPEILGPGTPMFEGLPDSQFTASNFWGLNCEPWQARFSSTYAWVPATFNTNQWLQVEFTQQILATHVATKGYPSCCGWVKSYKVLTSNDCINFNIIKDDLGNDKVLPRNTVIDMYVHDALEQRLVCRCFRVNSHSALKQIHSHLSLYLQVFTGNTDSDTPVQKHPEATCDVSLSPH